jgi:hypothetical protein
VVLECIDFEKELKSNCYERTIVTTLTTSTDYSIGNAILKFREYMSGESKFAHLNKKISQGHIDESVRFCWKFIKHLALTKQIKKQDHQM